MPSRTIRPTETPEPAPFTYTVSAPDGFTPEAVFATWDGSGAGGDFLPCVSYYNADGVLLDRAFPSGVTLTTGDVADASYRPFDRSVAVASSGPSASAFETFEDGAGVLIAPGAVVQLPWVRLGGPLLLNTGAVTTATVITAGVYAVTVMALAVSPSGAPYFFQASLFAGIGGTLSSLFGETPSDATGLNPGGVTLALTRGFAAGDGLRVQVKHEAAGNVRFSLRAVVQAFG